MNRGQSIGRAKSGSQRYLQDLVNSDQRYLNRLVLEKSASLRTWQDPIWVSPLSADNYREYYDSNFLNIINHADLRKKLREFWPRGGPHWDALACVDRNNGERGVILVEAKAKFAELGGLSYRCKAGDKSRQKIENTLNQVKDKLGVTANADWLGEYYQHANRIAHLYFLHVMCKIPTWLVYVCFIWAERAIVPPIEGDWTTPLANVQKAICLPKTHRLSSRIVYIFPKVPDLCGHSETIMPEEPDGGFTIDDSEILPPTKKEVEEEQKKSTTTK
ncbi:hypothetical protein ACFLWS_06330 [Chloroflexota bacterium]